MSGGIGVAGGASRRSALVAFTQRSTGKQKAPPDGEACIRGDFWKVRNIVLTV